MHVEYKGKVIKLKLKEGALSLDLSGEKIEDISLIEGLDKHPNLQVLNLGYNQISEIKGLSKLTNLKRLNLSNNNIFEIKELGNLINLEELNLSKNNLTEIKGLENLSKLKELNLWKNQINKIKGLNDLSDLQKLILIDNDIRTITIENVESLKNLEVLALQANPIYPALKQLSGSTTVKKVLEYNDLSPEKRKEIANKTRLTARAIEKQEKTQISILKPLIIIFGILSMCYNWTTISLTFTYFFQNITVFYNYNAFGIITGTSFTNIDLTLGYYDRFMQLGGVLYYIGILFGFITFMKQPRSIPHVSLISISLIIFGIFTYIGGAIVALEDWYDYLDPSLIISYGVKKGIQFQLGLFLAFLTLGLIVAELVLFLSKLKVLKYLKIDVKGLFYRLFYPKKATHLIQKNDEGERKLSPLKVKIWFLSLLVIGIYSITVYIILSIQDIPLQDRTNMILCYAFVEPIAFYLSCIIGYI
ncbi:MAG: leucine-rich repeat domain-containing protein, partial [Promethearchaeota archaeon]